MHVLHSHGGSFCLGFHLTIFRGSALPLPPFAATRLRLRGSGECDGISDGNVIVVAASVFLCVSTLFGCGLGWGGAARRPVRPARRSGSPGRSPRKNWWCISICIIVVFQSSLIRSAMASPIPDRADNQ